MASMNVSLPDPMREFVQARIENGRYASVSDYVRDLIRRDQAELEGEKRWLHGLDASIERAIEDAREGRVRDLDEVCAELDADLATLTGAQPDR